LILQVKANKILLESRKINQKPGINVTCDQ